MMKKLLYTFCIGLGFSFNAIAQAPTITSVSPLNAPVGTSLTLTGTNFNTTAANNVVFFGVVAAVPTVATSTSLTLTVPVGASYAMLRVLNTQNSLIGSSLQYFNPTFSPSKSDITLNDIAPKQDFADGSKPSSTAMGDLDGDGKPDLALTDHQSSSVSVFRNTGTVGNPAFAPRQIFTVGPFPYSVDIGDLDGDGKPDLVVANGGSNNVSVLYNTGIVGSPTFAPKQDFNVGLNPSSVAIGDLDGDGKPDLAVANSGPDNVSVLRNIGTVGNPAFAPKIDFNVGQDPYFIAIGDLDGDGKLDLAASSNYSGTVSVLRNTGTVGNPAFAPKQDFTVGVYPRTVAIGDLDGDGKPELTVANSGSTYISVLRNIGTVGSPAFAVKQDIATGFFPISVTIGDLNGDGRPDLALTNNGSNTLSVLRNNGTLGSLAFSPKQDFVTGEGPVSLALGDLDGDGRLDLAVANYVSANISILRNNPQFVTLPVNFGEFTATKQANNVKLGWNTLSETNNKGFLVQKSNDGKSFTDLAFVDSKGQQAHHYSLLDNSPANGVNYYRLIQQDIDGKQTELSTKVVNYVLSNAEVKAWPSPVNDVLNVSFEAGKYQQLILVDVNGKKLQDSALSISQNAAKMDMRNYAKGTYLLVLKGTNGKHIVKVIK